MKAVRQLVFGLFAISGPLFYVLVFFFVTSRLFGEVNDPIGDSKIFEPMVLTWVALGTLIWGWMLVNVNAISPHGLYRNRLSDCFLARESEPYQPNWFQRLKRKLRGLPEPTRPIGSLKRLPVQDLNRSIAAPYHLVNAAVNLPSSDEPNLRGRDSDFFVFSKHVCGSPVTGYADTRRASKNDPQLDLGTAMAVSGAAVGPQMGWKTPQDFRFLLSLLNLRLGYWLANPLNPPRLSRNRLFGVPSGFHLLREMTGAAMDEHSRYFNVSDGGHIENLGVYELLRRKCKFIISIQAEGDPEMQFADFNLLQRYAQIDFGIDIEIDLTQLQPNERGISKSHAALGKVRYNSGTEEEETGWILVIKSALTGDEPDYVLDYNRQNASFPHESTADQIFSEAQFEAYRALGEASARSLFESEIMPAGEEENAVSVKSWFAALKRHFA